MRSAHNLDLRTTRTIRSAIEIRAPTRNGVERADRLCRVSGLEPHIRRVQGTVDKGTRIAIQTQPPGGRKIAMRPTVMTWEPPNELRWRSTFMSGRLFSGEHGFRLEPTAANRVRFVQEETFSGLLVPLYSRLRLPRTRLGFDETNEALRDRAERMATDAGAAIA